jgi:PHP domain
VALTGAVSGPGWKGMGNDTKGSISKISWNVTEFMMLKGQLHTHTTCSDGNLTPQEAADVYASLGFDFLAFTDHDHLLKPSYRKAIAAVHSELLIFFGVELTVPCSKGYVHVSRIEGEQDVLHIFNHLADYDLSLRDTLQCITDVAVRYPLDAVEVTHHGFPTPLFDTPEVGYPRVAADDSHDLFACGRGWIELDCTREKDAIIAAVREGRFRNGYSGRALPVRGNGKPIVQLA